MENKGSTIWFARQLLLQLRIPERHHIAVVTDEFGDVLGVVTMEDLFETLIGLEILDETDQVADLQEYARQQWKKRMDRQKNG